MKKLLLIPLASLLILMMFVTSSTTAGTAHATSVQTMQPQAHVLALAPMHALIPAVSCSGSSCNNTDQYNTGCASSKKSIANTTVTDPTTGITAQVDLEFSTTCQTNWTEAHSTNTSGAQCFYGEIIRASGPDGAAIVSDYTECNFTLINTDQVFSPTNKAQACGSVGKSTIVCTRFV